MKTNIKAAFIDPLFVLAYMDVMILLMFLFQVFIEKICGNRSVQIGTFANILLANISIFILYSFIFTRAETSIFSVNYIGDSLKRKTIRIFQLVIVYSLAFSNLTIRSEIDVVSILFFSIVASLIMALIMALIMSLYDNFSHKKQKLADLLLSFNENERIAIINLVESDISKIRKYKIICLVTPYVVPSEIPRDLSELFALWSLIPRAKRKDIRGYIRDGYLPKLED